MAEEGEEGEERGHKVIKEPERGRMTVLGCLRLATPTPGIAKYRDNQLFHGTVNPVNLLCCLSHNKGRE